MHGSGSGSDLKIISKFLKFYCSNMILVQLYLIEIQASQNTDPDPDPGLFRIPDPDTGFFQIKDPDPAKTPGSGSETLEY